MDKTLVAGTLVAVVAVGGFSLGRLTQFDQAQAGSVGGGQPTPAFRPAQGHPS